jgi:F-type H+-transporting ATPase subunit alpha
MMENIKISEISEILRKQLEGIDMQVQFDEIGEVIEVKDGVVHIYGLNNVGANELLEFENGMKAIAMDLKNDSVSAILLGYTDKVKEGDIVKRISIFFPEQIR